MSESIWTQSNQGDTTTFWSCGICGASVQRQDRETHQEWHRERLGDGAPRYEALSRSWMRPFKHMFVPARNLMAPLLWSEWAQNVIYRELHVLDLYNRNS